MFLSCFVVEDEI